MAGKIRTNSHRIQEAEQAVSHQPAISFSISIQRHFKRAGGRTSNVLEMKSILLPAPDVAELRKVAHVAITRLTISGGSVTTLQLVEAIHEQVEHLRSEGSRPANELVNELGFLYGYCAQGEMSWEWHLIEYDDGACDYAVVHPQRKFYVLPRTMVWDYFYGKKQNLTLQFRMLVAGGLPNGPDWILLE